MPMKASFRPVYSGVVYNQGAGWLATCQRNQPGTPLIASPGEVGLWSLREVVLEDWSVDAVREVTELIEAQRGYEMNAKVISAADQMMAATAQVR